jgi:hypothetical protein
LLKFFGGLPEVGFLCGNALENFKKKSPWPPGGVKKFDRKYTITFFPDKIKNRE